MSWSYIFPYIPNAKKKLFICPRDFCLFSVPFFVVVVVKLIQAFIICVWRSFTPFIWTSALTMIPCTILVRFVFVIQPAQKQFFNWQRTLLFLWNFFLCILWQIKLINIKFQFHVPTARNVRNGLAKINDLFYHHSNEITIKLNRNLRTLKYAITIKSNEMNTK